MARSVRIKDHHAEQRLFEGRAIAAAIIMLVALGSVIVRLVWLQVVQYDYFADLSQGNRIKIEPIPPNRGLILDRNGLPLATNAPSYQLELTREQVADIDATLIGLAQLGLIDNADFPRLKKDIRSRRSLRCRAGEAAAHGRGAGTLRRPPLPVPRRGDPAAPDSLLPAGCQQRACDRLRRRHQRGRREDARPQRVCRHDADRQERRRACVRKRVARATRESSNCSSMPRAAASNASARTRSTLERHEPIAGNDLFLTIDLRVQQAAEEALRGQRAAAVAIDPTNGDVIAFVSTPAFDPNLFARGLTRPQYLALTEDPDRPMYDRALRGVYPPGSTVKPIFALAALESGVVTPQRHAVLPRHVVRSRLRPGAARLEARRARHRRHAPGARHVLRRLLLRHRAPDGHRSDGERRLDSSGSAPRPGSTSKASARASCRRPNGRSAHTSARSSRSGSRATRSA